MEMITNTLNELQDVLYFAADDDAFPDEEFDADDEDLNDTEDFDDEDDLDTEDFDDEDEDDGLTDDRL